MLLNKRGAALLQVLIVAAILAGMSAMILRLSLSRTITSRQTRRTIQAQSVIEACMAQVNAMWAAKTPVAYARDLAACQMCDPATDQEAGCPGAGETSPQQIYTCSIPLFKDQSPYTVEARIEPSNNGTGKPPCKITYTIIGGRNTL